MLRRRLCWAIPILDQFLVARRAAAVPGAPAVLLVVDPRVVAVVVSAAAAVVDVVALQSHYLRPQWLPWPGCQFVQQRR